MKMFEKNKEKMKEKMEPDKVLRFAIVAVILLFLIGALIIGTRMMNPRVDATEGVKKLTELEDANVQKIDAKIQELEQTEADEAAAWKAKSAKEKMDGCIVLGDSTALGFRQNDILSKSQVKSKDGAMVSDAEGSGLNELLTAVTEADTAPQKLILCIGRGDVAVSGETADTFAANYKSFVEQVKAALPDTKVYVCSIPAYQSLTSTGDATSSADSDNDSDSDAASDSKDTTDNSDSKSSTDSKSNIDSKSSTDSKSNSDTSSDDSSSSKMSTVLDVTSYNEALKTLCKEEKVKYVDTTDLTDASYYGEDGSTMTKAYYEACINKILEAAFRNYVIQ
jgi:lysophospholipase L1-like esterase